MVSPVAPATGWLSQVFGEWMQVGGAYRSRGPPLPSADGLRPRAQPLALPRATRMPLGFSVFLVRACACARVCVRGVRACVHAQVCTSMYAHVCVCVSQCGSGVRGTQETVHRVRPTENIIYWEDTKPACSQEMKCR